MTLTLTLNASQRVARTGTTLFTPAAVYEAARHLTSLSQEHLLCFTLFPNVQRNILRSLNCIPAFLTISSHNG